MALTTASSPVVSTHRSDSRFILCIYGTFQVSDSVDREFKRRTRLPWLSSTRPIVTLESLVHPSPTHFSKASRRIANVSRGWTLAFADSRVVTGDEDAGLNHGRVHPPAARAERRRLLQRLQRHAAARLPS